MKNKIITLILFAFALSVAFVTVLPANAQLGGYIGDTNLIQGGAAKNCTNVIIGGSLGTTPFTMEVVFDPTNQNSISESHLGISKPIYQKSDQTLVFYTNDTDHYTVKVSLNYNTDEKRDVAIRHTSGANDALYQEDIQYTGTTFCRVFDITTKPPVHIQTREEILGQDLIDVPKAINQLIQTTQYNTIVESNTFGSITIMLVVVVGVIVVLILIFATTRGQSRRTRIQTQDNLKTVRTMAQTMVATTTDIKKENKQMQTEFMNMVKLFGGFLVELKNTIAMSDAAKKQLEKLESLNKKIVEPPPPPQQQKKKVISQIFDRIVKTDTKSLTTTLSKLRGKEDEQSIEEAAAIEEELKKRSLSGKHTVETPAENFESLEKKPSPEQELENLYQNIKSGKLKINETETEVLTSIYNYKCKNVSGDDYDFVKTIYREIRSRWERKNQT